VNRQSRHYKNAFKVIHYVLMNEWNPIGIGDEPLAQDEYEPYVSVIYRLLCEGAESDRLAKHCGWVESE